MEKYFYNLIAFIFEIFFSEISWLQSYRNNKKELEKEMFYNYMIQRENSSVTFNSFDIHEFVKYYTTSISKDRRLDILYDILSDYNKEYIGHRNYKLSYLKFIYGLIDYEEYYNNIDNDILIQIIQNSVLYRTNKSEIFNMMIVDINNKMIYH